MQITLKGALALIDKIYHNGQLNRFSIEYFTKTGQRHLKQMCSKADPYADTDFEAVAEKVGNEGHTKKFYQVREKRVIRLFDLEKRQHFSIKTDLLIRLNNMTINHEEQ